MSLGIAVIALLLTPAYHLASYCHGQGDDLAEAGHWRAAATAFGRAIGHEPDDPGNYLAQAAMFGFAGDRAQAWALLVKAAELNPYSATAREAQAEWLSAQGRAVEALTQMDEAIKRYPSHVGHRLTRAAMRFRAGRTAQAREDLLYIEKNELPIWEYQQTPYNQLRRAVGLKPIQFMP
jgi:tetratricopeptide (TPR) repeat protein